MIAETDALGREEVEIGDFATLSVRCTIFSSNDDYSGATMANATIPAAYRGASDAPVHVRSHAIVGAGCAILPGVTLGDSALYDRSWRSGPCHRPPARGALGIGRAVAARRSAAKCRIASLTGGISPGSLRT
jgi:hypothetical protein